MNIWSDTTQLRLDVPHLNNALANSLCCGRMSNNQTKSGNLDKLRDILSLRFTSHKSDSISFSTAMDSPLYPHIQSQLFTSQQKFCSLRFDTNAQRSIRTIQAHSSHSFVYPHGKETPRRWTTFIFTWHSRADLHRRDLEGVFVHSDACHAVRTPHTLAPTLGLLWTAASVNP